MSNSDPFITWRLIESGNSDGLHNMAIDEALLRSFEPNNSSPVLRLYGWNPPALSIGRFQDAAGTIDLERCHSAGLPVVRRITGGGAIYHADELTYSIICTPDQIPPATSVKDSFRVLTGFILEFYNRLGLEACYAYETVSHAERLGVRSAFCFAGKETFDIMIRHWKIGGNAQRRHRNIIFQHGSIPVVSRAHQGLQYMIDQSPEHVGHTISLTDCGIVADMPNLSRMLAAAFRHHMKCGTCRGDLTHDEQDSAQSLTTGKYLSESWNIRGETN